MFFSRKLILLFSFVLVFAFCASIVSAAPKALKPRSRGIIPLPTGDCGDVKCNVDTHLCEDIDSNKEVTPLSECEYSIADFAGLFVMLAEFMLTVTGSLSLAFFIYGGFMWIFSGGNKERIGKGKKVIGGALTGLFITLGAWVIVNFIIAAITGSGFTDVQIFGQKWWEIKQ